MEFLPYGNPMHAFSHFLCCSRAKISSCKATGLTSIDFSLNETEASIQSLECAVFYILICLPNLGTVMPGLLLFKGRTSCNGPSIPISCGFGMEIITIPLFITLSWFGPILILLLKFLIRMVPLLLIVLLLSKFSLTFTLIFGRILQTLALLTFFVPYLAISQGFWFGRSGSYTWSYSGGSVWCYARAALK